MTATGHGRTRPGARGAPTSALSFDRTGTRPIPPRAGLAWITGQAILNIGAVLAVFSVSGVPLPLVSYGGTSLIILLFATGILLSIATKTPSRSPAHSVGRRT